MIELLIEAAHALGHFLFVVLSGLKRIGEICFYFTRDTFRAHFNLIAQKTAPFEQEILRKTPPKPSDLNILGQLALTIIPVTIVSWVLALTLAPLIYNSSLLLISFFIRATNLALLDIPEKKLPSPEGSMPWYRVVYGLPGLLFGTALGLVSAGIIGLARSVTNSFKTIPHSFASVVNLALDEDDEFEDWGLNQDKRPFAQKYILGAFGLLLGGMAGVIGFGVVGIGRVISNSFKTTRAIFISEINLVLDSEIEVKDKRSWTQKYLLGAMGIPFGVFLGTVGFLTIGFSRIISNSWQTTRGLAISGANQLRHSDEQLSGGLSDDHRSALHRYVLGFPGLIIGVFAALLAIGVSSIRRIIIESAKTTAAVFIEISQFALEEEEDAHSLLPDLRPERRFVDRFLFGAPGLVLGTIAGSLSFLVIVAARIIKNSAESAILGFAAVTNLALDEEDELDEGKLVNDKRSFANRYILGGFGLLLGTAAGTLGFTTVLLGRIIHNSIQTAISVSGSAYKLALNRQSNAVEEDQRPGFHKYVLGLPGLVLGLFTGTLAFTIGCIQRVISESIVSLQEAFIVVVNQALPEAVELDDSKRHPVDRFIFGSLGLAGGAILGFAGFLAIGIARVIVSSAESAAHSFASVTNLALHKEDRFKTWGLKQDKRPPHITYGLGFPGIILGGIAGMVGFIDVAFGRIISNSFQTAFSLSVSAINIVVHKEIKAGLQHETRSPFRTYVLGLPGLIIGVIPAAISFLIAGLRRVIIETAKTGKEVAELIVDKALPENLKNKKPAQQRLFYDIYLFGAAGFIAGSVIGGMGFLAVGAIRVISNSLESAFRLTISAINAVNYDEETIAGDLQHDPRSGARKFGFGFPGLILGSITASIAILFTIARRMVIESAISGSVVYEAVVNEARSVRVKESAKTERSLVNQVLGLPGILAGLAVGAIGFGLIGARRIVTNSAASFIHVLISTTNLALDPEDENTEYGLKKDSRPFFHTYGLGLFGVVLGGLAGGLSFLAVGMARVISNSYTTAVSLSLSAYYLITPANGNKAGLDDDSRSVFRKFILGSPGLLIGSISAGFAILAAVTQRIIVESGHTAVESFIYLQNSTVPPEEEIPPPAIPRSFANRFIFGAPGLLLGGIPGVFFVTISIMSQVVANSIQSGKWTYIVVANLGLSKENEFDYPDRQEEAKRSLLSKSLLGLPGIVIGSILGAITLLTIASAKLVYHNARSFLSLSGSILNGSLELPVFSGLAGDKRDNLSKSVGVFGYGLALAAVLPVGATILFFRKVVPVIIALVLGFVCAPLVAALKGLALAAKKPRFEPDAPAEDLREQQFKNIYSSLTPWGQLPENSQIRSDGNGRKGAVCFTRKALTFNTSTMTEYCLDQLLEAYRRSADKENFFEQEFPQEVQKIKAHYQVFSFIELQQEVEMRERQIDEIAQFVKDYVNRKVSQVPNIYSKPENSWSSLFWGKPTAESVEGNSTLQPGTSV
ncbi:hypothetical protein B1207_06115 [Legionella quinlivanii]|uniref:Uncharacterized protein n=1 Tax=Legionella quinlivanii TaxID=45073 RepID=A0A364LK72_9GAMM|nr:hypothetical protein [Legionella quinlivanii]RAP37002.1 hypothetical protein B1207_06115 [Legionella quinlivanii]